MLPRKLLAAVALCTAVSGSQDCWMKDHSATRWQDGKMCVYTEEIGDGVFQVQMESYCEDACLEDPLCQGATYRDNEIGCFSLDCMPFCRKWKNNCGSTNNVLFLGQNYWHLYYNKECWQAPQAGAIHGRYGSTYGTSQDMLWGAAPDNSAHNCKASGCAAGQCCYGTLEEAKTECQPDEECIGFWRSEFDGFYYVRGTGAGTWIDNENYPNSVYYLKQKHVPAPLCELMSDQANTGYWGCGTSPCLDDNLSYPSYTAARRRCYEVTGCDVVMKWVDGRYYLRNYNVDPLITDDGNYPSVRWWQNNCDTEIPDYDEEGWE